MRTSPLGSRTRHLQIVEGGFRIERDIGFHRNFLAGQRDSSITLRHVGIDQLICLWLAGRLESNDLPDLVRREDLVASELVSNVRHAALAADRNQLEVVTEV